MPAAVTGIETTASCLPHGCLNGTIKLILKWGRFPAARAMVALSDYEMGIVWGLT
jgi:hypothetical protein